MRKILLIDNKIIYKLNNKLGFSEKESQTKV